MKRYLSKGKLLVGALATATLLSGCGNSDDFVFTNTNLNQVAAPVAVDDAFNALGNATVNRAAAGVLANDTANAGTITGFDAVGSNGGAIALNADGSFAYTPVFGFVGAETFTYTLENAGGTSTATVTMTSTGLGHFVDNTAAPGGNGSQANPFDTLAAAIAAANAGDTIFVSRGDGTNNGLAGAVLLPAGVDLIGEGAGLVIAQTIIPAGLAPVITGPVTCLGTNTISGFTIDGSGSDSIIINGVGDVTITGNTISNPTDNHVDCDDVSGTITISNNTMSDPPNTDVDYIELFNTNVNGTVSVTNNIFENAASNDMDGLFEPDVEGTSAMTLIFSGNDAIGAVADQFEHAFYLDCADTADVTVTVDDNDLTNFTSEPIGIHANDNGVRLGGTITNNRITNVSGDDGIDAAINGDTITISGNVISNVSEDGIDLAVESLGGTFLVVNNNISNASDDGVDFDDSEDGDVSIAARDNSVTNSSSQAFDFDWDGAGTVCIDFTGNTVTQDVRFDDDGPGTVNVEQLNDLEDMGLTGNDFVNPATTSVDSDVNNVADGFCAIP
jgi:hypothetical protein